MLIGSVIRIRRSSLWIVIGLSLRFGGSLLCCWIIKWGCLERVPSRMIKRWAETALKRTEQHDKVNE